MLEWTESILVTPRATNTIIILMNGLFKQFRMARTQKMVGEGLHSGAVVQTTIPILYNLILHLLHFFRHNKTPRARRHPQNITLSTILHNPCTICPISCTSTNDKSNFTQLFKKERDV